jgi:hypothetical protein
LFKIYIGEKDNDLKYLDLKAQNKKKFKISIYRKQLPLTTAFIKIFVIIWNLKNKPLFLVNKINTYVICPKIKEDRKEIFEKILCGNNYTLQIIGDTI